MEPPCCVKSSLLSLEYSRALPDKMFHTLVECHSNPKHERGRKCISEVSTHGIHHGGKLDVGVVLINRQLVQVFSKFNKDQ
jgi:hypothetical protein